MDDDMHGEAERSETALLEQKKWDVKPRRHRCNRRLLMTALRSYKVGQCQNQLP